MIRTVGLVMWYAVQAFPGISKRVFVTGVSSSSHKVYKNAALKISCVQLRPRSDVSFRMIMKWCYFIKVYINKCLTRCNTKQSTFYSASSLYMFRVSTTPIIRSTQNCNYSLRYLPPTWPSWPRWRAVAAQKTCQYRRLQLHLCVFLMMGVVDARNM